MALDLLNTRTASTDLLATLEDLRVWLVLQASRMPDPAPVEIAKLTTADLEAVQDVREHTTTALAHLRRGQKPPRRSIEWLNAAQRAAPTILELTAHGASVAARPVRVGPPGARLAASLAEAAVILLTHPDLDKIRQCEADDCVMLFVASRPSRRWCASNRCGNRARVARHYRRHKADES